MTLKSLDILELTKPMTFLGEISIGLGWERMCINLSLLVTPAKGINPLTNLLLVFSNPWELPQGNGNRSP